MKKFALRNLVLLLCLTMAISFTGCASEAKKAMDESVDTANELLEKDAEPFDAETAFCALRRSQMRFRTAALRSITAVHF